MLTKSQAFEFLKAHNIRPKKSMGQNFLVDPNIYRKIVAFIDPQPDDIIIEIGPGMGSLTDELLDSREVICIEKDRILAALLARRFAQNDKIKVMHADVLETEFRNLLSFSQKNVKIVGNLPYYITTPILFKLIDEIEVFGRAFIMIQKEVARRVAAGPGTKEYGILAIAAQVNFEVKILTDISRNSFFPAPKVDSSFVMLTPRAADKFDIDDKEKFTKIVRAGFNQRRKTLFNSLSHNLGIAKDNLLKVFKAAGLDLKIRAEELTIKDFARLSNNIQLL